MLATANRQPAIWKSGIPGLMIMLDVVITTTCGVRQSAENRIYSLIPDIKKIIRRKVVLTGCLSDRPDGKED